MTPPLTTRWHCRMLLFLLTYKSSIRYRTRLNAALTNTWNLYWPSTLMAYIIKSYEKVLQWTAICHNNTDLVQLKLHLLIFGDWLLFYITIFLCNSIIIITVHILPSISKCTHCTIKKFCLSQLHHSGSWQKFSQFRTSTWASIAIK